MTATRKSTPKYLVITVDSGAGVYGPASKTECKTIAGQMNIRGRKQSVEVVRARLWNSGLQSFPAGNALAA